VKRPVTRRLGGGVTLFVLLLLAPRPGAGQSVAVPVVAVGEGRSFPAALATAIRMAVESGAGATVQGSVTSRGERVMTDSIRAVSRGVVTRYVVLDSGAVGGGMRVRIMAMVSRIAEGEAAGARARRIAAPGELWTANATLESDRRADEGRLLSEIFGAIDRQPNAYSYEVEAGPPVASGADLRLRLRVIRSPSPAYEILRNRARAILSAVAGPAGARTLHVPPLASEQVEVLPCVSHCGLSERRVLNPRAALDDTDSLGSFDPPVLTSVSAVRVPTLFPDLRSAGGFAVAFTDTAKQRQELVHIRSTQGYLAVVDYLRTTFDEARFRLQLDDWGIDVIESFRAPWTGQPQHRFSTTALPGKPPITLVQGFRAHTSGGPGAATTLGSGYVVLVLPAAEPARTDTALVDIRLAPEEVARISELGVAPLPTTHRLPAITCPAPRPPRATGGSGARKTCIRPSAVDVMWRSLDEEHPLAPAPARPSTEAPTGVPLAVLDAIASPPLSDGDGAVSLPGRAAASVIAVGTAVVDPAAPTQACSVARLRSQRELVRFLVGSRLEGRIGMSSSESRGGQVQELFREDITENVAGRLVGAALAAQWTAHAPERCRVALWLSDGLSVRRAASPDSGELRRVP
jgi:hypothetical protein